MATVFEVDEAFAPFSEFPSDAEASQLVEGDGGAPSEPAHEPNAAQIDTPQPVAASPPPTTAEKSDPPNFVGLAAQRHARKLADAEHAISEAIRHQKSLERQLKSAKAEVKAALEELEEVIVTGPNPLALQREWERANAAAALAAEAAKSGVTPPVDEESWRAAKIDELQLSESLYEKLYAAGIETAGDWADLEAEACCGKRKWPKGIGEKKQSEIGDKFADFIGRWRKSTQAAAEAAAMAVEPIAADVATENAAEENHSVKKTTPEISAAEKSWAGNFPDEKSPAQVQADEESDRLWAYIRSPEFEAYRSLGATAFFQAGYEAYEDGLKIESIPAALQNDPRKDWLKGWLEAADDAATKAIEDRDQPEPVRSPPAPDPLDDI
jgi:ribosome modulation factor